jgi:hypothetical protein
VIAARCKAMERKASASFLHVIAGKFGQEIAIIFW